MFSCSNKLPKEKSSVSCGANWPQPLRPAYANLKMEYSMEVIYCSSDQNYDTRQKDTAAPPPQKKGVEL